MFFFFLVLALFFSVSHSSYPDPPTPPRIQYGGFKPIFGPVSYNREPHSIQFNEISQAPLPQRSYHQALPVPMKDYKPVPRKHYPMPEFLATHQRHQPPPPPQPVPQTVPQPVPTYQPQVAPSYQPQVAPSHQPQTVPSHQPQAVPSHQPQAAPSYQPQVAPTHQPDPSLNEIIPQAQPQHDPVKKEMFMIPMAHAPETTAASPQPTPLFDVKSLLPVQAFQKSPSQIQPVISDNLILPPSSREELQSYVPTTSPPLPPPKVEKITKPIPPPVQRPLSSQPVKRQPVVIPQPAAPQLLPVSRPIQRVPEANSLPLHQNILKPAQPNHVQQHQLPSQRPVQQHFQDVQKPLQAQQTVQVHQPPSVQQPLFQSKPAPVQQQPIVVPQTFRPPPTVASPTPSAPQVVPVFDLRVQSPTQNVPVKILKSPQLPLSNEIQTDLSPFPVPLKNAGVLPLRNELPSTIHRFPPYSNFEGPSHS